MRSTRRRTSLCHPGAAVSSRRRAEHHGPGKARGIPQEQGHRYKVYDPTPTFSFLTGHLTRTGSARPHRRDPRQRQEAGLQGHRRYRQGHPGNQIEKNPFSGPGPAVCLVVAVRAAPSYGALRSFPRDLKVVPRQVETRLPDRLVRIRPLPGHLVRPSCRTPRFRVISDRLPPAPTRPPWSSCRPPSGLSEPRLSFRGALQDRSPPLFC